MFNNKKHIEVNGKEYTLTVKRSMFIELQNIVPELIKFGENGGKNVTKEMEVEASLKIYDNMDKIFYSMIKIEHPELTKEQSDEIYEAFYNEYNDVDEKLIEFMQSSFTDGIPRENKKNLNW